MTWYSNASVKVIRILCRRTGTQSCIQLINPLLASCSNLLFQMSNYVCWLCEKKEDRKSDLKYHVSSVHDRLKVICAWCEGKELSFRKAVDLKAHMKSNHKSIMRNAPADCFGGTELLLSSETPQRLREGHPTDQVGQFRCQVPQESCGKVVAYS